MNNETFYNISKIIERDSKATTYKFALLRGVIDIIQDNSPYITFIDNRVQIPTGLLIEKWLLYYYPIFHSKIPIPQINGGAKLAFSARFEVLINHYVTRGGFSAFYNDLRNKGIPKDLQADFFELAKQLRDTITRMPMKYIGRSISNEYYSIFNFENTNLTRTPLTGVGQLIHDFGTFSISYEYFEAFRLLGSFINGQDSILFKWAEFSVTASGDKIPLSKVLNEVLKGPITKREVEKSKKLYAEILRDKGMLQCVWTREKIISLDESNIDHLIPFSVWKNNDLWNLLPATRSINNNKRDKIPSPEIIERQKDLILNYWETIFESQSTRFQKEMQVALLGNNVWGSWKDIGISQLQNSCAYLIENRGFEAWKI
jgi:hypothetical protein